MRRFAILLLALPAAAFSQQTTQSTDQQTSNTQNTYARSTLTSLAGQFFNGDFVNFFGTAEGLFDHGAYGGTGGSSGGFAANGGVRAYHLFRDSELSLSYNLGYTHYGSGGYASGFNQNLSLIYTKTLSRRWSIGFVESGGMFRYGVSYYPQPDGGTQAIANPFSPVTKFLSSEVSLTYRQTARLSYIFSGNFYLSRYDAPGAIGTTGATGSGSVSYRLTERTTVGGTYSHSYYAYQHGAGDAVMDGGYFNLSHQFPQFWTAGFDVGITRTDSSGFIHIPINIIVNGVPVTGYVVGPYQQTRITPTLQGHISRRLRHIVATVSAGQGVNPGNGVYLASRNQFLSGSVSYTGSPRSNISASGGYWHLTSLANAIPNSSSGSYSTGSFGASYSYTLAHHLAAHIRYDYFRYGGVATYSGSADNRISFGITFSSASIPVTFF